MSVFNITEVIIAILLMLIILVQNKNVSLNLTSMGGGMGAVTKRGGEKILQNLTIIFAVLFILNSLYLYIR